MKLNNNDIVNSYNNLNSIWSHNDMWHYHTYKNISTFIKKIFSKYMKESEKITVLNAGSGGNEYGIKSKKHIHIDLAEKNIIGKSHYIIGSIENIPLKQTSIDFILCVGSVLNYTDALKVVKEFYKLLKNNSYLILEFETSNSLEYFGTSAFNKNVDIVTTFYNGKEEKIWVYSLSYVKQILECTGFKILEKKHIHIFTPLVYFLSKNEKLSSKFVWTDVIFRNIPFLKNHSSNVILFCQKV